MRKRIYRISEDKFDDLKPNIEFETQQIEETCFVGDSFSGSISFKSTNGIKVRGVVYCNNPYVKIDNPLFDGLNIKIDYKIDDYSFKAGEGLSGDFIVVVVGQEKYIPFSITYTRRSLMATTGEITSLQDFADLAQSRFSEAVAVFYSDRFADFISGLDKRTRLLYRGFKAAPIAAINVDEFLVSCGLKPQMTFDVKEGYHKYYEVDENLKGEVEITRSTWGYIDISVSCDADFISIEKSHITSDFFLGSIFTMNYYVHKEKMHAGLNYAKISFDYRDVHKEINIVASTLKEGATLESENHSKNLLVLKACRMYEDFRLRNISTGQWCKGTLEIIDSIENAVNPNGVYDNFVHLMKALIYVTNNQKQEALWIIQDLKRTIEDKGSAEWAFLLYICTLIEREEDYVDRLTANIEAIFREHPNDVRIFWFLLFLRREYLKNPTAKLRDITDWIMDGWDSPLLYIEAYYIFIQDPYLINCLDDFTIKILNWAKKRGAITREIGLQMVHVLETERKFDFRMLSILDACYEAYPDLKLLLAIVTYLLKAPYTDERFLKWFQMAIDANLHVSGIFEAYMDALPEYSVDKLPQILTMFFKYNNDLSYEKKALLYANIILHRNDDNNTYQHYESAIETFALEQLKLGRLDDNLAVCYQRLMELGIFDKEVARLISELVFKKKVAVISSNVRRIFLYHEEFKAPTIANVSNHKAYVPYIGSQPVVFLETDDGYLYVDDSAYFIEDILDAGSYMDNLKSLTSLNMSFALSDFSSKTDMSQSTEADVEAAEMLLDSRQISPDYLSTLYPKIIDVLKFHDKESIIEKHFMHQADLKSLKAEVVAAVIEVFVLRSKYDEAFYMLKNTNATKLKPEVTRKICQYFINETPDEPDDFLIVMCAKLAADGYLASDILHYLIRFYVGPTDSMMPLFKEAYERGDDIVEFAERIITQVLYRDFLCEGIMEVFDAYISRRNNKMIVEAFLTYQAHEYLSKDVQIPEEIFAYIYNRYKKALNVNESMRIALLKYLCTSKSLDEDDMNMLDALLADAILRNQYFGFFANCDERLKIKYHLYDKQFIEINTEKRKSVVITYAINGNDPEEEDMIEMYDGLYVKQFILFFGDELRYEIYCDELSEDPLKKDTMVMSQENDVSQGRFALMNNISRSLLYNDYAELAADAKRYQGLDAVTKSLFTTV